MHGIESSGQPIALASQEIDQLQQGGGDRRIVAPAASFGGTGIGECGVPEIPVAVFGIPLELLVERRGPAVVYDPGIDGWGTRAAEPVTVGEALFVEDRHIEARAAMLGEQEVERLLLTAIAGH